METTAFACRPAGSSPHLSHIEESVRVAATILPSVAARALPVAAALTTMIRAPITVRDGQPRPILVVNAARALIAAARSELCVVAGKCS